MNIKKGVKFQKKLFSQEFQIRGYFLTYVVLKTRKMSSNVFPYRWYTL